MRLDFADNQMDQHDAPKLRGYIANQFPHYIELHHHLEKDRVLYKYPCIQYKVIKGIPIVIGINSGVKILQTIYGFVDELKFEGETQIIYEKYITLKDEPFGISREMVAYHFLTLWVALNEKNYQRYKFLGRKGQVELLHRILIGNILSMAKSLQYVVIDEIKVNTRLKPVKTKLKSIPMIGFTGEFQVNFNLPDYIGLGKSVSRGFGTIKRIQRGNRITTDYFTIEG